MWDFIVRVVCEKECELKTKEVFVGSSREAFPQSEACAQHITRIQRVMTDDDSWFSLVSRREGLPARYPRNILFCQFVISNTPCLYPHYIYPHYSHILRSTFREKTITTTFES